MSFFQDCVKKPALLFSYGKLSLVKNSACHVKIAPQLPWQQYPWTWCALNRTIIMNTVHWLIGNPRRFKTYVGNRISFILDQILPDRWKHVPGILNPADCASRGLFPLQLKDHCLWWNGPQYLRLKPSLWPEQPSSLSEVVPTEEREICNMNTVTQPGSVDAQVLFISRESLRGFIVSFTIFALLFLADMLHLIS